MNILYVVMTLYNFIKVYFGNKKNFDFLLVNISNYAISDNGISIITSSATYMKNLRDKMVSKI